MADQFISHNDKLGALNKKIFEVKKKIQLSDGQRKANFEECDAKKRECAEKISQLKREVKELLVEFTKAKNNEEATERAARLNRDSSAYSGKRGLNETLVLLDEHNIRLRKKLDLAKYQSDKLQKHLQKLLSEYEELMNGKPTKIMTKSTCRTIRREIVKLENQLHRISIMQMEADTVRKKYQAVRASLKSDASLYAACLDSLEENIREQENEIKRLENVKIEAMELRDTTKENLTKQEIEAMLTSRERESIIQEYRKRVEMRKVELERLERQMFPMAPRQMAREDLDTGRKSPAPESARDPPQNEIERLEEAFITLKTITGVSKTEDVLNRFLAQKATNEKLKKMRTTTENEKVQLEKRRQQLTAEMEMLKFAETKDADQNADKVEKLHKQIEEQRQLEINALSKLEKHQTSLETIKDKLFSFCEKFEQEFGSDGKNVDVETIAPLKTLARLNNKIKVFIKKIGGPAKYKEFIDQILNENVQTLSLAKTSEIKQTVSEDQPLFPLFPMVTTPAAHPIQISEDEDDVPSRMLLKRQAQILVDTKSRRKGFSFKR